MCAACLGAVSWDLGESEGFGSSAADRRPATPPRHHASDWARGAVILGCSLVVYCELGRF